MSVDLDKICEALATWSALPCSCKDCLGCEGSEAEALLLDAVPGLLAEIERLTVERDGARETLRNIAEAQEPSEVYDPCDGEQAGALLALFRLTGVDAQLIAGAIKTARLGEQDKAADEIKRLTKEDARLRDALARCKKWAPTNSIDDIVEDALAGAP